MTVTTLNWRRKAVCAVETSSAPELWTPDRLPPIAVRKSMESMCHRCPVLRRCADDAVRNDDEGGLFAGVWVPHRGERTRWDDAIQRLREIADPSPQFAVQYTELEPSA